VRPTADRDRRLSGQAAPGPDRFGYSNEVGSFHLFTIKGVPVSVSPFYFLLLLMFARGDVMRGIIWAVCITLSLLVHEFGHALVAKRLRHDPSIMLHGFGGLTSRSRTGRDVEEAAIIAMGPAAGLALGLGIFGLWHLMTHAGMEAFAFSRLTTEVLYALLYPCITWNLLNLIPLWPLDGGQLFRLGVLRFARPRSADVVTHGLSLLLIGAAAIWAIQAQAIFAILVLLLLGMQNVQALRGERSSGSVQQSSSHASPLVQSARAALDAGEFKEAARLSHQARSLDSVSPADLDKIWEILGLATAAQGEHEEALSYLRRARPSAAIREATERSLAALDREDELEDIAARWHATPRAPQMHRWLIGALGFIVLAVGFVFTTSLSAFFL
jgi:stage IV sporulation protein FB